MSQDHKTSGEKTQTSAIAGLPWLRVSFFLFACGFLIIALSPLPSKVWREIQHKKKPELAVEKPKLNSPKPPELQIPKAPVVHTASSGGNIRKLSKGFELETKITVAEGDLSSKERSKKGSYTAYYELKVNLPKPSETLKELEEVNPQLGSILPSLETMLKTAKTSRFFYQIYENKVNRLKLKSNQLNELMTKHNFYDCETILNLKHPETGQKLLLLQSEMDVVSDGSDGDRLPEMPDKLLNSSNYQPMTSYGWTKIGETPNPLIKGWKGRIKKAEEEIAKIETTKTRSDWLKTRIKKIQREIEDMTYRSYLVADYDPFIVLPINMVTFKGDPYSGKIGDYAVVIYNGKIYPCIVGDAGPSFKTGEASLRMAKTLNSRAGIYSRPVSDLTVTYLVFPNSADKFQEPHYEHWKKRCGELLQKAGGLGEGYHLETWKNTFPVKN